MTEIAINMTLEEWAKQKIESFGSVVILVMGSDVRGKEKPEGEPLAREIAHTITDAKNEVVDMESAWDDWHADFGDTVFLPVHQDISKEKLHELHTTILGRGIDVNIVAHTWADPPYRLKEQAHAGVEVDGDGTPIKAYRMVVDGFNGDIYNELMAGVFKHD